jgi:hypothetical protein
MRFVAGQQAAKKTLQHAMATVKALDLDLTIRRSRAGERSMWL